VKLSLILSNYSRLSTWPLITSELYKRKIQLAETMEQFLSKLIAGRWQQLNRKQALAYGDRGADDGDQS
jgi:hypothetical protein